jgi:hypothetical protein
MISTTFDLTGIAGIQLIVDAIEEVAGVELARVYSIGAFNQLTGERYDKKVMDRREQAEIHKGWWSTYDDIAEMNEAEIAGMVADYLSQVVGGANAGIRNLAERVGKRIYEIVTKYPPPRRYIRTFQLQQSHRWEALA